MNASEFLEKVYLEAKNQELVDNLALSNEIKKYIATIVSYEETMKGVFTCLVSSLTYKSLHPQQDVRYHKVDLPNGYSGRSFDTKNVTPKASFHVAFGE